MHKGTQIRLHPSGEQQREPTKRAAAELEEVGDKVGEVMWVNIVKYLESQHEEFGLIL